MMHLANGRCSKRFVFKWWQLISPAWAQVFLQNFLHKQTQKNALNTCTWALKSAVLSFKFLLMVHMMTTLTFICQVGMKSALCRTLSKIFCSWGLMKVLSEEKNKILSLWRNLNTILLFVLSLLCVPWMLSICPIFSAAPRTLQSVLTILSALASDRRGESNRALMSAKNSTTYLAVIHRSNLSWHLSSNCCRSLIKH